MPDRLTICKSPACHLTLMKGFECNRDFPPTEEIGCVGLSLNLVRVMQLLAHGFYN
jgi:hypothetical protein